MVSYGYTEKSQALAGKLRLGTARRNRKVLWQSWRGLSLYRTLVLFSQRSFRHVAKTDDRVVCTSRRYDGKILWDDLHVLSHVVIALWLITLMRLNSQYIVSQIAVVYIGRQTISVNVCVKISSTCESVGFAGVACFQSYDYDKLFGVCIHTPFFNEVELVFAEKKSICSATELLCSIPQTWCKLSRMILDTG